MANRSNKHPTSPPNPPAPSFDEDLLPLPSRISGIVVDSAEQPVANAQVTVLVRRFSSATDDESNGPGPWSTVTDV